MWRFFNWLAVGVIAISAGCSAFAKQQTVKFPDATTQPTRQEAKQTNGTVAVDAEHAHVMDSVIRRADGNQATFNFDFNSGWVPLLMAGGVMIVALVLIAHAYGTKRR